MIFALVQIILAIGLLISYHFTGDSDSLIIGCMLIVGAKVDILYSRLKK